MVDLRALRQQALESKFVKVTKTADTTQMLRSDSRKVYLFAEQDHPAYPSAVVLEEMNDGVIGFEAYCATEFDRCARWFTLVKDSRREYFKELNAYDRPGT